MQAARDQFGISERQACRYLRVNWRMVRYIRIVKDDTKLRARLEELAAERRRFGFRRLAVLLRRDGLIVIRLTAERLDAGDGYCVGNMARELLRRGGIEARLRAELLLDEGVDLLSSHGYSFEM